MVPYSPILTAFTWLARMFPEGKNIVISLIEGIFLKIITIIRADIWKK